MNLQYAHARTSGCAERIYSCQWKMAQEMQNGFEND